MDAKKRDLVRFLFFSSKRFSNGMQKIYQQVFENWNMSPFLIYMLMFIHQHHHITLPQLSREMPMSSDSCKKCVNQLILRGILKQEDQEGAMCLVFAEQGEEICEKLDKGLEELYKNYERTLGLEFSEQLAYELSAASNFLEESQLYKQSV